MTKARFYYRNFRLFDNSIWQSIRKTIGLLIMGVGNLKDWKNHKESE